MQPKTSRSLIARPDPSTGAQPVAHPTAGFGEFVGINLLPASAALAMLFLALAVLQPLVVPAAHRWSITGVTVLAALLLAAIAARARFWPVHPAHAERIGAAVCAVVLCHSVLLLGLLADPHYAVNLALTV